MEPFPYFPFIWDKDIFLHVPLAPKHYSLWGRKFALGSKTPANGTKWQWPVLEKSSPGLHPPGSTNQPIRISQAFYATISMEIMQT
jgi:hypothetical protein